MFRFRTLPKLRTRYLVIYYSKPTEDSRYNAVSPVVYVSGVDCVQRIYDSNENICNLDELEHEPLAHYVRYECDEKLECLWVFIVIMPETCQFITTFGAKNYLQEVHPPTRTANLSSQHEKKENVFPRAHVCVSVIPKSLQSH
jgi:hypothetical protein